MKLDLDRQGSGRTGLEVAERLLLEVDPDLALPADVVLRGRLTVDNLEGRCLVHGELAVTVTVACDRCLDDFALTYPAPVEITVVRAVSSEGEGDSWVIHQRQGEVALDEPLREAALLALPQKLLCRDDCRGICPRCGANRNREACACPDEASDPRWEGLPGR